MRDLLEDLESQFPSVFEEVGGRKVVVEMIKNHKEFFHLEESAVTSKQFDRSLQDWFPSTKFFYIGIEK